MVLVMLLTINSITSRQHVQLWQNLQVVLVWPVHSGPHQLVRPQAQPHSRTKHTLSSIKQDAQLDKHQSHFYAADVTLVTGHHGPADSVAHQLIIESDLLVGRQCLQPAYIKSDRGSKRLQLHGTPQVQCSQHRLYSLLYTNHQQHWSYQRCCTRLLVDIKAARGSNKYLTD